MNSSGSPPPPSAAPALPARPNGSVFLTVFAWCLLIVSALACLVSMAAALMLLGGHDGAANGNLLEGFMVIGVPPLTLAAGIGLLRRWRWAYGYALVLVAFVVVGNIATMVRGPTPQRTYASPSGVPTTVLATDVNYSAHILIVAGAVGLLAKLLTRSVREEFRWTSRRAVPASATRGRGIPSSATRSVAGTGAVAPSLRRPNDRPVADEARGWRVGHQGRDEMFYDEFINGNWERLRISGEMLMGRAHHVIYFASPQRWLDYPEWARHHREEIIGRIKSVFHAPDYEYLVDDTRSARSGLVSSQKPGPFAGSAARPPRSLAVYAAIAVLFTITGLMGWFVWRGVTSGETYLPIKNASHRRMVSRLKEPALYWVSIGAYSVAGAGALGLGVWLMREAFRLRRAGFGFGGDMKAKSG